ncbi:isopenicillin N synthase family dioxygenase [Roseivirga pacifica]|uniref:isopenicillin N synthase family dioxygenase n=1 Tax=Roseivirga pacifica TaxID=1267423 RepID=UPI00209545E9|nr:2-oxoglutarate and iron-dependent oxygenase domain-containing protein [Roseivirga pacifica]MCO6359446.1 isopenicillin N synthase family oxygenase [Roseivirga pacifica]MCO6366816.1 isopenicillin N synthase family oxygenase [Roseivirga pacifica]MCO6370652.1 isopenicillin N synthase family oxygenase [Roseivirga pacifica]MCO6374472.1 isopenicillin N synthase family oxygenase [Roseivirga pacifica]MCO6379731.1 isopenicillin N synthase family oxygenase [Roseivirga pacifica]
MSQKLYDEIPSLDLADFTSGDQEKKDKFVQALGAAYNDIGFVAIKNHGLTDEMTQKLYSTIQAFFALPDDVKQQYEVPELAGQRGYIGKGKEHAKGRKTGDLKEFYHVGQDVTDNDPIKEQYPDNIWPKELPEMEEVGLTVYKTLEAAGIKMLQAIALYLGLEEHYFDKKVHNGNSILRPIHYFPIENPDEVPEDAVRAAEHGDINLITLLMGASADGLQVLRRDNEWIPITALPDQIVVNVGDMLSRLTNNKLKSTIHRVVNPPKEEMKNSRFSIPFFMHPRSEMDLTCLENCIDADHPKLYEDITAGEFLEQRLAEIGLRKK